MNDLLRSLDRGTINLDEIFEVRPMKSKKTILLVEDDRIDAMTVKRALKEIKVVNPVVVANNG